MPSGATFTPRLVRAAAVPALSVSVVPTPVRAGMAVTVSGVVEAPETAAGAARAARGRTDGHRGAEVQRVYDWTVS